MQTEEPGARQLEQVRELGRRLLYIVGPEEKSYPNPPGNDEPAVFVRGLEETAEGCRWLLQRWAEFRNLMNHKSWWGTAPMVRFIRLQGKHPVEAFYDPALNSIFLAWDVLAPKSIETFWHLYRTSASLCDPAYSHLLKWAALAPRPQDQTEAWAILHDVVAQHVRRLEDLLARHEAISADESAARADRAALDCSKEFERHRHYQSARTRELLRTLDTLRRMRIAAHGMWSGEGDMTDDTWQKADVGCRLPDGDFSLADDEGRAGGGAARSGYERCEVEARGSEGNQSSETVTEGSSGPTTGLDSNLVDDSSTSDTIGVLSGEDTNASDQAGQRDDVGPWFSERVTARRIEPIKANRGLEQDPKDRGV